MAETVSEGHKTRGAAIMAAIEAAQADLGPGDWSMVTACIGEGCPHAEPWEADQSRCASCSRIRVEAKIAQA